MGDENGGGGAATLLGGCGCLVVAAMMGMMGFVVVFGGGSTSANLVPVSDGTLDTSKIPSQYVSWVQQAGSMCPEITAPVIAAQIEAESNWDPTIVSPAGAEGISQFMPETFPHWAKDDDHNGTVTPFDPGDSIMAQGRYDCALAGDVQKLVQQGGAQGDILSLTLASYNAGFGNVQKYAGIPPFPETQGYVKRILSLIGKYSVMSGAGATGGGPFAQAEIAAAEKWLGTPYSWGGGDETGPTYGSAQGANIDGFDCSGLVLYSVYQASGGKLDLPHEASLQVLRGTPVNRAQMQPGDVIGFDLQGTGIDHIGIYIGNNEMVEAPHTGDVVKIEPLDTKYWQDVPWTVVRFG